MCCCVHLDANNGCDAGSHDEIQECCDANHPCKEGQGDCDHDSECLGNLVCGNGNCDKSKFPSNDTDCCTKGNTMKLMTCWCHYTAAILHV